MEYPGLKWEWLTYCGLGRTAEEAQIRDWVAKLCDLKAPTDRQELILTLAGVYLTAMDLPSGAFNPAELFDLVKADIAEESNRNR